MLVLDSPDQFKALFDETRIAIVRLLEERAATITQIAAALDRPKGTIGHHVGVLESTGLIHVVRTKRVRAIEAKYYGRTARTFELSAMQDFGVQPNVMLTTAASEIAAAAGQFAGTEGLASASSVRHARIDHERARDFGERLFALIDEFTSSKRSGDVVYGMAVAIYPTVRPWLPKEAE